MIFDFYTKYFNWLLNLTNVNYFFSVDLNGGEINNPYISILKGLIMAPFIMIAISVPILWICRIIIWAFTVILDDIR